jgi:hypothetical protein
MRAETSKKLDRLLVRRRFANITAVVGVVAVVGGLFVLQDVLRQRSADDPVVARVLLGGTVTQWRYAQTRQSGGSQLITVHVRLDDGREVDAGTTTHPAAKVGEHIEVTERRHASGRVAHVWE